MIKNSNFEKIKKEYYEKSSKIDRKFLDDGSKTIEYIENCHPIFKQGFCELDIFQRFDSDDHFFANGNIFRYFFLHRRFNL